MAVQLPYFQPITWEQANPALTGAQQGQQMVYQGLQNYMLGSQTPYAANNAYLDNYSKNITNEYLPYTLTANALNNMTSMVLAGTHPQLIKPVLDNMARVLPSNAQLPASGPNGSIPQGYSTNPNASWLDNLEQGLRNFFVAPDRSNQSSNNTTYSGPAATTAEKPQKVSDSDNAGLVTINGNKSGSPTVTSNSKSLANGKTAYQLSDGSWIMR